MFNNSIFKIKLFVFYFCSCKIECFIIHIYVRCNLIENVVLYHKMWLMKILFYEWCIGNKLVAIFPNNNQILYDEYVYYMYLYMHVR